jgi:hypothetical protein
MFSLTASGTIGKTIVMSKWKGRAYARTRVIPFNGRTGPQQLVRGALGVVAKAAAAVLTAAKDTLPGMGSQFFLDTLTHIPGTKSWVAQMQANFGQTVTADAATLAGLGAVNTAYGVGAAAAGLADYTTVGDTPVTYPANFQLYTLAKFAAASLGYTGFTTGGPDAAITAEITAFVTYLQTSV